MVSNPQVTVIVNKHECECKLSAAQSAATGLFDCSSLTSGTGVLECIMLPAPGPHHPGLQACVLIQLVWQMPCGTAVQGRVAKAM